MTTQTRQQEIREIWNQYQGLYVMAGVLIGLLLFPFLELVITDLSQLLIGLVPEAIGIGFTVLILDRIYQQREEKRNIENQKQQYIRDAGSSVPGVAIKAVEDLRNHCWLEDVEGLLKGTNLSLAQLGNAPLWYANLQEVTFWNANLREANLFKANLQRANLSKANLQQAHLVLANLQYTNLSNSNLQHAKLESANLMKSRLSEANLQYADLAGTNLELTNLESANLQDTNLESAKLQGANLSHANLQNANLSQASLQGVNLSNAKIANIIWEVQEDGKVYTTTLPDGELWTADTEMGKFTDPSHPEFEATLEKINGIRAEMGILPIQS